MVKKNKFIRRVGALFSAAFILAVFVFCSFAAPAHAMVVVPDNSDGRYLDPAVWYMSLPFDQITNNLVVPGISCENPMYSVAVENGFNVQTNIEMPTASSVSGSDFLGRWHFGVRSVSDVPYFDGYKQASFDVQIDSSSNASEITLSCSSPFVASALLFEDFSLLSTVFVPAGFDYSCEVSMIVSYPRLINASGWELSGTAASASLHVSNVGGGYGPVYAFPPWYDFGLSDIIDDKMFIVNSLSVTYSLFNPLDGSYDDTYNPSLMDFTFPFLDPDSRLTFDDFFEAYPGHRVIVSDDPTASSFDLLLYLKNGLEGFMKTEFAPGLSPGGILSACVAICLVLAFLKFFAGG